MGTKIEVTLNLEVRRKTSRKIKDEIVQELQRWFIETKFAGNHIEFNDILLLSYSTAADLEYFKFPKNFTKHLVQADLQITYLDYAPVKKFNLIEDEYE